VSCKFENGRLAKQELGVLHKEAGNSVFDVFLLFSYLFQARRCEQWGGNFVATTNLLS
jgi:hypothetical protein